MCCLCLGRGNRELNKEPMTFDEDEGSEAEKRQKGAEWDCEDERRLRMEDDKVIVWRHGENCLF